MDLLLLILGFICVIIGVLGSFLPILPGPILSWIGLLLLYMTNGVVDNYWVLGITLFVTISSIFMDYIIPAKGTKSLGGSKYGVWGTNVGMLVGFFIPIPFGFIIGAFLGAFIGEFYFEKQDKKKALKSATGSFLGFLASTFLKFFISAIFLGIFIYVVLKNRTFLFN